MDGIVFPTMTGQEEAQVRRPRQAATAGRSGSGSGVAAPLPAPAGVAPSALLPIGNLPSWTLQGCFMPECAMSAAAPPPLRSQRLYLPHPQAVVKTETDAVAAEGEAPRAGTAHYAVAMPWFSAWCRYSGFTYDARRRRAEVVAQQEPGPRPGPVDNTPLLGQHPVGWMLTEGSQRAAG